MAEQAGNLGAMYQSSALAEQDYHPNFKKNPRKSISTHRLTDKLRSYPLHTKLRKISYKTQRERNEINNIHKEMIPLSNGRGN